MQRTRRQAALTEQVPIEMSGGDQRRAAAFDTTLAVNQRPESEQIGRWENEGGSIGYGVGRSVARSSTNSTEPATTRA
jgi:hypothetical protein